MPHHGLEGYSPEDEAISTSTLILIGVVILSCSILIAVVVTHVQHGRHNRIDQNDEEEAALLEEEPLPPYDVPPPAYVAELDTGDGNRLDYPIEVGVKGQGRIRLI